MTSPNLTLVNLFSTLEMEFDASAADALINRKKYVTKEAGKIKKRVEKYYSTHRNDEIDIHKWKKQLSVDQILYIENHCMEFMKKVDYKD